MCCKKGTMMNKEDSLEEDIRHGTTERPITAIHFTTGAGTAFPEKFYVQRHWHHSVEMLKIIKGTFTVELNLENHTLTAGDICIINSGELHKLDGKERDTIHDVLIFDPHILQFSYHDEYQSMLVEPLLTYENSFLHIIHSGSPEYSKIEEMFEKMTGEVLAQQEGWYFSAKIYLMELLKRMNENRWIIPSASVQNAADKEKIHRYKKIVSYIEENYMKKITLSQFAGLIGCNPQYLCHFFREISGESPIRYLIAYRVERAAEILLDTTRPVLEVSLDCGFENVSYFIRQFKRSYGMTPREYRQKWGRL